jgi:putative phosphoribosyl transferase
MRFADRVAAGRDLGRRLTEAGGIAGRVVVLGLPRGGIPVACEVAAALDAPVDALVVRKLGAPFNPELALGAIAHGGVTVYNDELLEQLNLSESDLDAIRGQELAELERRERAYRAGRPPLATPEPYFGVGAWYARFPQLTDQEVVDALAGSHAERRRGAPS